MAKNWTMAEAMNEIAKREINSEAIADLYRRFPNVSRLMTAIAAGDTMAAQILIGFLPEWATVGKVEKAIKTSGDSVNAEDEDNTSVDEDSTEESEDEAPKSKKPKKAKKVVDDEAEDDEDIDESVDYESMKPQELFKMCKEKGIKVMAKKDSKYYARKLKEFEAKEAEAEDDWDEDEAEEEKPKKKAVKANEKPKKAKKEPVDDDDEDWDI